MYCSAIPQFSESFETKNVAIGDQKLKRDDSGK